MSYSNDSFWGDWLCLEYDQQNNPLNPESSFGFFLYQMIGFSFDGMDDLIAQYNYDTSLVSNYIRTSFLNLLGRNWKLPRPSINNVPLTDKEYKIYLYLKRCRLLTIEDLLICFNKCMSKEDNDVRVRVHTEEVDYMTTIDHPHYSLDGVDLSRSNLGKHTGDTGINYVISFEDSSEVSRLIGRKTRDYDTVVVVEVPNDGWSKGFLTLLESFISIKGNVLIREYVE